MKKILLILLIINSTIVYSQEIFFSNGEKCGTEIYTRILEEKYKDYALSREKVNMQTEMWLKNNQHNNTNKSIITIPVVVHVVWNTNTENISDAQIFSQIDVLNADYRRTNTAAINTPSVWQSIAADCEINFCLATIDPNGSATTGITRTQTSCC